MHDEATPRHLQSLFQAPFLDWKRIQVSRLRDSGVVVALVALFVVLSIVSPPFFTVRNLKNILDEWSMQGVMAAALTLLLISGGFDLSMGAVFALSGVIAAKVTLHSSAALGMSAGCLAGLGVGLVNGIIVNVFRINAFVATLATSIMIAGGALGITGGLVIYANDPSFAIVGNHGFAGLLYTIWIFIAAVIITAVLLHRTTFGRYIYAVGGNPEAARLSGLPVGLISTAAFGLSGFAAGIAGVVSASRVSAGQSDVGGYTLLFDVFAVVVIGGTSIAGGVGAIWRTVVGVFLLALIGNGFNLLAVDIVYQDIVFGALILLAVAMDVWGRRGRT